MSRGVPNKTKKITISALLAAIGVVLLFLGAMIETLDLSMAALASFFCIFAVIELGGAFPWLIFAVTSVLSTVLMPHSMGGWFYALFFGYYPILKEKIERLKRPIAWIVKFIIFNIALLVGTSVAFFIFFGHTEGKTLTDAFIYVFGGEEMGVWLSLAMYALFNIVFIIYDIATTKLITFYFVKIRPRFKFMK